MSTFNLEIDRERPIILVGLHGYPKKRVDAAISLLEGGHEELAYRVAREDGVLHFDMASLPDRGDALDHFHRGSAVIAHHLYYDGQETHPFFYNQKNERIVDLAGAAGVPLFIFGDYPLRARKPDQKTSSFRLYLPVRENPLAKWQKTDPRTAGKVDRAHRILYGKRSQEVFTKKLRGVPLDLWIVVGKLTPPQEKRMRETAAAEKGTVLWIPEPLDLTPEESAAVEHIFEAPRGSAGRLSAMTPFTLLHRMGDVILDSYSAEVKAAENNLQDPPDAEAREFPVPSAAFRQRGRSYPPSVYNVGVDTLSGREGWLNNEGNATADLWAKYLLTGRVAFDPYAPLPDMPQGYPWITREKAQELRLQWYKAMKEYFPVWVERARGKVFDLSFAANIRSAARFYLYRAALKAAAEAEAEARRKRWE